MDYLTVADIARMAVAFGAAVRDRGLLESAVRNCQSTFDGEDLYPDLAAKAAALLVGIAQNQPFIDANKRTAFSAAVVFLALNGYDLEMEQGEVFEMMIALAEGALDTEKIAETIRLYAHARR